MAAVKTNAMRILDAKKIKYKHYEYDPETTDGVKVAELLHEPREIVFKTLVTVATSKNNYVFVIPVAMELILKTAAKTVGEKSIEMVQVSELNALTGTVWLCLGIFAVITTALEFTIKPLEKLISLMFSKPKRKVIEK